ncbi:MAG: LLM class flavin-dependent oxidoreductase [Acidimicrobiia bacterium]|nr:LLM class flavin-dependent oxidoreductase [Acidimicrobiia bacterium]MBT8192279.1 LLM class flavin-dependent oxidoreductase [Acidimicrobiia bacterium]MBT8247095.1 LLM class flavin-dependent oxidoreductase [Acidimicrobiia bacterium]NNF88810.1 LLM class flavin-dependent oxidoreductase [Acidimicrobiia bacterium]NNJ47697.1 LLM class flavin-dependent oxidoreductase [Acidimicrobiia bacterium]
MDFSLMTEPQMGGTYDQLLVLARWAENRGLVSFARSDHYYSSADPAHDATDAFATLAGLARETETIRLCVLVSPVTFRHPAVIVKNALTIDQMSEGRFDLGIGTGWMSEEHEAFGLDLWPMAERFGRFDDALHYVKAAFGPQPARYDGTFYQLNADVKPGPIGPLPVIVGGTGKKRTPTLAGRYADEYNQSAAPVAVLAENIQTMRQAAEAAGRDPAEIVTSIMGSVLIGNDEGSFRDHLAAAALQRNTEPKDLQDRFEQAGMPVGAADKAQDLMGRWEEAGVDRFYVRQMEIDDLDLLDEKLTALGG